MYEDEIVTSSSIIRQCEQSPPFQENARSLIVLLQTVADEIKEHEKEMKPKADRTMTKNNYSGSCEARMFIRIQTCCFGLQLTRICTNTKLMTISKSGTTTI